LPVACCLLPVACFWGSGLGLRALGHFLFPVSCFLFLNHPVTFGNTPKILLDFLARNEYSFLTARDNPK